MQLIFAGFLITNIWALVGIFSGGAGSIIMAITFTPINAFLMLPMWLNTYYLVDENELLIKCGLGKGTRLDVGQIISICETNDPTNSPALSMSRLEIRYRAKSGGFSDTIIISPKDKQGFIEQLRIKNENIEVSGEKKPMSKPTKVLLLITGVILAITVIGVGALFIVGEREPSVTIGSDSIRISAMYGTTVDVADITGISLLDQSMREFGAGRRINGYNGSAWRGHFAAGLLFVRPDVSPTIRIERNNGSTIFISFRDPTRTLALYENLGLLM